MIIIPVPINKSLFVKPLKQNQKNKTKVITDSFHRLKSLVRPSVRIDKMYMLCLKMCLWLRMVVLHVLLEIFHAVFLERLVDEVREGVAVQNLNVIVKL